MKRGVFIVLEGLDGAGKSTHSSWLADYLMRHGHSVLRTREPGGTAYGEAVRPIFLQKNITVDAELLLLFSLRLQHVHEKIEPALQAGQIVICERFIDATYAYQSGGRGADYEKIRRIEQAIGPFPRIDVTFFLDASFPDIAARLQLHQSDRFERQDEDFFCRVRRLYHRRVAEDPHRFVVIDACRPVSVIRSSMLSALEERGLMGSTNDVL